MFNRWIKTIALALVIIFLVSPAVADVILISFSPIWSNDGTSISIEWETATEVNHAGFYVLRSESKFGEYIQINDALIPAEGSDTEGAVYFYEDTDVNPGSVYWYRLEAID